MASSSDSRLSFSSSRKNEGGALTQGCGTGALRGGRSEAGGRRPPAERSAQLPLRPAAERSGSTLPFRNKLPPVASTRRNPEAHICTGPRQGGVCKGQRPLLPVILSLTTDLCTVLIRSVLIVQSCTHMRQLITQRLQRAARGRTRPEAMSYEECVVPVRTLSYPVVPGRTPGRTYRDYSWEGTKYENLDVRHPF